MFEPTHPIGSYVSVAQGEGTPPKIQRVVGFRLLEHKSPNGGTHLVEYADVEYKHADGATQQNRYAAAGPDCPLTPCDAPEGAPPPPTVN